MYSKLINTGRLFITPFLGTKIWSFINIALHATSMHYMEAGGIPKFRFEKSYFFKKFKALSNLASSLNSTFIFLHFCGYTLKEQRDPLPLGVGIIRCWSNQIISSIPPTLKLYCTILLGACGLLAVNILVNSSFSSASVSSSWSSGLISCLGWNIQVNIINASSPSIII